MYPWTFGISDLAGASYSRLRSAEDRVVDYPHNGARTASFTLPITRDAQVQAQIDLLMTGLALVKAYRGTELMFHGPVVGISRVGDGDTRSIAVNAMDPMFILDRRNLDGQQSLLPSPGPNKDFTLTLDSARMARRFLEDRQWEAAGSDTTLEDAKNHDNHGVYIGPNAADSGYTISFRYSRPGSKLGPTIRELSASASGFDWRLRPLEYARRTNVTPTRNSAVSAPTISEWVTSAVIGQQRPNCVFSYGGGGRSLTRAEYVLSRETMATSIGHSNAAVPAAQVIYDETTYSTGEALMLGYTQEDVIESDIIDTTSRSNLIDLHLQLRRSPRRTLSVSPAVYDAAQPNRVPQYGQDWDVGDWVWMRGYDVGGLWFDGWTRIWGATFRPDANGAERVDLTLVPDDVS
jgi:hypothetical protein